MAYQLKEDWAMVRISADAIEDGLRISIDLPHGYDEVVISWKVLASYLQRHYIAEAPVVVNMPKPRKMKKS